MAPKILAALGVAAALAASLTACGSAPVTHTTARTSFHCYLDEMPSSAVEVVTPDATAAACARSATLVSTLSQTTFVAVKVLMGTQACTMAGGAAAYAADADDVVYADNVCSEWDNAATG